MKINKELIVAMKSPPPERLAKIEYNSHVLGIIGTLTTCSILIYLGYWYVIFAFIFSLGVSYSQAVQANQKYNMIMAFKTDVYDPLADKSPSRRRSFIVREVLGQKITWLVSASSVALAAWIINPLHARWYQQIVLLLLIIAFYILIYFFVLYWIASPIYKRRQNKKECKEVQDGTN